MYAPQVSSFPSLRKQLESLDQIVDEETRARHEMQEYQVSQLTSGLEPSLLPESNSDAPAPNRRTRRSTSLASRNDARLQEASQGLLSIFPVVKGRSIAATLGRTAIDDNARELYDSILAHPAQSKKSYLHQRRAWMWIGYRIAEDFRSHVSYAICNVSCQMDWFRYCPSLPFYLLATAHKTGDMDTTL